MGSRYNRIEKKPAVSYMSMDASIERLKKMRALNCNPSDLGMANFIFKKIVLGRSGGSIKIY